MLELLKIFYIFFKIGLFTIGGGYAMIPMIESEVISNDWITETNLANFLAISESTPGPFAINIATFIGTTRFGFVGALMATLGVITPSFIIIILIYKIYEKVINNKYIDASMSGIKAIVVGLIFTVGIKLIFNELYKNGFTKILDIDYKAIIIFAILLGLSIIFKKKLGPILLIGISAVLGIVLYGLI